MKKGLKFKQKIMFFIVAVIALLSLTIISTVYFNAKNALEAKVNKQLNDTNKLGYLYLDTIFPGDWKADGNKLYKGDKLINDDTTVVDAIKNITSSPVTIFLNDTRVATSVVIDSKRQTGTKVSEAIAKIVLTEGQNYEGTADVVGVKYKALYSPIKDKDGKTIGIWFVGTELESMKKDINGLIFNIIILIAIVIVLCTFLANAFSKAMNKNIQKALLSLHDASTGNLTNKCSINSSDEIKDIGDSINLVFENTGTLIKEISTASDKVYSEASSFNNLSNSMFISIKEVSAAVEGVSKGATIQASDLVNITEAITKFSEELSEIIKAIKNIDENSQTINSKTKISDSDIKNLIQSMESTNNLFEGFTKDFKYLDEEIRRIENFTILINNIAEQTNMLSLNASIEAARAGEAGKGFSVVAEEIRKLASECKDSAANISSIASEIIGSTEKISSNSLNINSEIKNQMTAAVKVVDSFDDILSGISNINSKINDVSTSASKIDNEKNALTNKLESISSTAQEIAASSEEISASVEGLTENANTIADSSLDLKNVSEEIKKSTSKFTI